MKTQPTHASSSTTCRVWVSLLALLVASALAAPAARAQTWMVSTTAYVKLGVLDKYNSLGGYKAIFIVTGEKEGQQFILEQEVPRGESGADVLFPSEPSAPNYFKNMKGLAASPAPGRYTWECRVNGKKAVGGFFNYPETGNDVTVINK